MGKQIGSDEKPITFRSPIYKNTHGSKGANPRPGFYTQDYRENWDRIFGKKKTERRKKTMINKWLDKVKKAYAKLFKKALAPKKQTTKRKTNVKRTTRKKSK